MTGEPLTLVRPPASIAEPGATRAARVADRLTPAWIALAILAAALAYRLWAILVEVPAPTGDEQLTGIVAKHVAEGRSVPTYLYGQFYMGAFEAYVAAPFVTLFGTTVLGLRFGMLLLYTVFFLASYRLAARVFSPWFAVAVAGLLALGSDRVLRDELMANGGYPEMLALGALLTLLTAALCDPAPGVPARTALCAAWGLVAGLVIWADWLIAPYVGMLGLTLLVFRWRDALRPYLLVLLGGLGIGLAPMIWYNLHAPEGQDTLTAVLAFDEVRVRADGWDHYFTGVLLNVPRATGMCAPECAPWQLWWGVAYQLLLVAAIAMGAAGLWRARRGGAGPEAVRAAILLALGVAALATIVLYARSPRAVQDAFWNARYLSNLLISTPAILWPLWTLVRSTRRLARAVGIATLAAVLATGVTASVAVVTEGVPFARAERRTLEALITALDGIGADRVYTDFQLCYRLIYTTDERIICAILDDRMVRGWDRYLPYRDTVDAADRPVYILRAGEPMDDQFRAHVREVDVDVDTVEVAGYRIYRPARLLDIPR